MGGHVEDIKNSASSALSKAGNINGHPTTDFHEYTGETWGEREHREREQREREHREREHREREQREREQREREQREREQREREQGEREQREREQREREQEMQRERERLREIQSEREERERQERDRGQEIQREREEREREQEIQTETEREHEIQREREERETEQAIQIEREVMSLYSSAIQREREFQNEVTKFINMLMEISVQGFSYHIFQNKVSEFNDIRRTIVNLGTDSAVRQFFPDHDPLKIKLINEKVEMTLQE